MGLIVQSMKDRSRINSPGHLADVYDAHAPRLYRYALMILADPSNAEDAVQQTFAKLASMGPRISQLASLDSYLRTAVRNECYRILSRARARRQIHKQSFLTLRTTAQTKNNKDQHQVVEHVLRSLPAQQREIIHLKLYEDMTFQQIGQTLDLSINTVASRYRYALEKLRRLLGPHFTDTGLIK